MDSNRQCPECGTSLGADAPGGLCPRCLVQQGLAMLALEPKAESPADKTQQVGSLPVFASSLALPRRFGDYELLEKIAQGGMGIVYCARQITLNRPVALKMILSGQLATPAEVQRFRTEAEAAAKLDHPNIVPIYEIGEHEAQHYFSMKLVEGRRLSEEIGSKPLPVRRAAQLLAKIARAVHFAHQRGILHRDLKPTNVLVDQQGEPQLTDFGLAKILEQDSTLTGSAMVMGTASYMAPEQARGETKQITTAVDIYGLGALFYEMLTARPPFQGRSAVEIMHKVAEEEPARPSALNSQVEKDLETICLKCLEKSPEHRYASAEALALDLERWLSGETISARTSTAWERTVKWARRKPAIAALLTALVLVGLTGMYGVLWQWGQAEEARLWAERKARGEESQRKLFQATARELRRNLYVADINLAQQALVDNNLGRAVQLIRKYVPGPGEEDLRGFEWRYLWNQTRGDELFTFTHDNFVEAAAFSPDGKWLATADRDNIIKVWDVSERKLVARLTDLDDVVGRGAFLLFSSDNHSLVAYAGNRDMLWVWETSNWSFRTKLNNVKPPVFFLPGSDSLVGRTTGGMAYWNTTRWEQTEVNGEAFPGLTRNFTASLNGKMIACSSGDDRVQVWDVTTSTRIAEFPFRLEAVNDIVTAIAVASDGSLFAIADWKGRVKLWDTRSGREAGVWPAHTSPIYGLAFSPDDRSLATGGLDQVINIWRVSNQTRIGTLRGHSNEVWTVTFSPDGKILASTSKDGTAKLWSSEIQEKSVALADTLVPMAFLSESTRLLALKPDRTLALWDLNARREIDQVPVLNRAATHAPSPTEVPVQPNETNEYIGMLLPNLDSIELWAKRDPHGTKIIVSREGPGFMATLSPDKKLMAAAADREIKLVDLAGGKELARFKEASGPLAFSPDGRRLAGSAAGYTVLLLDVASKNKVATLQGHRWGIWNVTFSPDSRLLVTTSIDATARIWNAENGALLAVLTGHKEGVRCAAFSPDGKTLATGSTDDTVKFWSMLNFQELLTINNFGEDVGTLMFSPDGQTLAVGCFPNRGGRNPIQLWQAPSLAQIKARDKIKNSAN